MEKWINMPFLWWWNIWLYWSEKVKPKQLSRKKMFKSIYQAYKCAYKYANIHMHYLWDPTFSTDAHVCTQFLVPSLLLLPVINWQNTPGRCGQHQQDLKHTVKQKRDQENNKTKEEEIDRRWGESIVAGSRGPGWGLCKSPYISCHPMGFQRATTEKHNRLDRWSQTNCSEFDAIKSCLPHARRQRV